MTFRSFILFVALAVLSPAYLIAQGAQVAFGNTDPDSSLPVEITADQLRVDQAGGFAVFSGNVLIGQGEMRISAPKVEVFYTSTTQGNPGEISRMVATGGVTIVNGPEAAESNSAEYFVDKGAIVMTGDVFLTQGNNVMSSSSMVVDLNTGTAALEGRVKSILQTGTDN